MTWKESDTPSGRVLFRLRVSVLSTSATGCGLLPTLTVHGNHNRPGYNPDSGWGLAALLRFLPTLTAADADRGNVTYKRGNPALRMTLQELLPTLTANDAKNNGGPSQRMKRFSTPLNAIVGGPLNPRFCEEYMGYPIGWTELED